MFGDVLPDVPVVEISIDGSLSPEKNWAVGRAVQALRDEGILVLSGGLTVHNLRDFSSFVKGSAGELHKAFDQAVLDAVTVPDVSGCLLAAVAELKLTRIYRNKHGTMHLSLLPNTVASGRLIRVRTTLYPSTLRLARAKAGTCVC
jgi:aromatic ring-opening dioxygenase catalytic subunit (LigB family)